MAYWVLHVDLDQFLAAVEILRRPELAGLPVVVGGAGDPAQRAVVATASYPARERGVRSGMPLRTAARRCPDAVFLPADNAHYTEVSAQVMATLRGFGDLVVEVMGWDEAFLGADTDDPEALARTVQRAVLDRTRLHCAVGIGDNLLRAKLATGFGKPAGVFRLTAANWAEVMGDRPTRALWGIGGADRRHPRRARPADGARAGRDRSRRARRRARAHGPWYVQLGRSIGRTRVQDTPRVARSRSRETTFQDNLTGWDEVRAEVVALARRVATDIAADGRPAARVAVKVRFAPFSTSTRSTTLDVATADPARLEAAALQVLERFDPTRPVRLLGVRAEFDRT